MSEEETLYLATRTQVTYVRPGEVIFQKDHKPGEYFYMVRSGAVDLVDGDEMIDVFDEGDLFGIRPLLAKDTYRGSSVVREEGIIYFLPLISGKKILEGNARVALYFAQDFASSRKGLRTQGLEAITLADVRKDVLCGTVEVLIRHAALDMSERGVGSYVVVDDLKRPVGIVTDRDLRVQVATGKVPLEDPVTAIMSSPVRTMAPDQSHAAYLIQMVERKIHHLVITEDGTSNTAVVGMVSEHDILAAQGDHPALIIREIRSANSREKAMEWRDKGDRLIERYLEQDVQASTISALSTAMNEAVYRRVAREVERELGPPPCHYTWLLLGSLGRREQLIRTDQDHALVLEDRNEDIDAYFKRWAEGVCEGLSAFGFEPDAVEIMPTERKWRSSIAEWKERFSSWIRIPDEEHVLQTTIFFDFRPIEGPDERSRALAEHIYAECDLHERFASFLARDGAETPPPLSFFRQFIVEKSGEHRDEFDLKLRVLLPLVDVARILTLQHQIMDINNTRERYLKAAQVEPTNAKLFRDAAEAFDYALKLRGSVGMRHRTSGRYIPLSELSKMERQSLRSIFEVIQSLQSMLKVRFQLNYFRS